MTRCGSAPKTLGTVSCSWRPEGAESQCTQSSLGESICTDGRLEKGVRKMVSGGWHFKLVFLVTSIQLLRTSSAPTRTATLVLCIRRPKNKGPLPCVYRLSSRMTTILVHLISFPVPIISNAPVPSAISDGPAVQSSEFSFILDMTRSRLEPDDRRLFLHLISGCKCGFGRMLRPFPLA